MLEQSNDKARPGTQMPITQAPTVAFFLPDSVSPLFERNSPFNTLPLGLCQSKTSGDDENAGRDPVFHPERVIAHCFQQFKQKDFHLPQSRRRIITLPQNEDPTPSNLAAPPQTLPQPVSSFKALGAGDVAGQPEDTRTWLRQRLKLRRNLESFGDTEKWLQNKPCLTPSEAKVLYTIQKEREAQLLACQTPTRATKVSRPLC